MEKRTSLEIIAPSVEEAVERGLADLGLPEDAVEVEVLDMGSRGLFGLGSRQARVRLTIKTAGEEEIQPTASPREAIRPEKSERETVGAEPEAEIAEEEEPEALEAEADEAQVEEEDESEQDDLALDVARETVEELLGQMKVRAQVTSSYGEPEDARSKTPLLVDVRGSDLSILIGPRAETLDALQYIASLIVGKELGRSVPLVVDVEGFRQRRAQQLRQLAQRMADQAVKTGRRQTLEPMPANERRLVHIELRNNPDVTTESVGEDPKRKVTIIPK
ncbi:MAG: RNA-binding cell elongation regulator Jag/EloR [Chloroflexota bacterium]